MNIIVMKKIGFCYGVNRSIEITNKVKDNYKEPWILLGPLVHNDYVNNDLMNSGYQMLNNKNAINNYQNATFISTAHGIDPILKEQIEKNNTLVDTTCPIVLNNNKKIFKYFADGFDVVYIGKKNHQESNGIKNYIHLIENVKDIKNLILTSSKIVLTNQTTMSIKDIEECKNELIKIYPNCLIDTVICPATKERQIELLDHLNKYHSPADKWLIIGDKKSNNTNKLYELANSFTNNLHYVESVDDIKQIDFSNTSNLLVTSGTSTPNTIITEIVEYIKENIQ